MPPKRQRLAAAEGAAGVAEVEGRPVNETLAAASDQNVGKFLQRASKRRAKAAGDGAPAPIAHGLAAPAAASLIPGLPAARRAKAVGACGAAAVTDRDKEGEEEGEPADAAGNGAAQDFLALANGNGSLAASEEEQLPGWQQASGSGFAGEEEEADEEGAGWQQEDEEDDEEDWEDAWGDEDEAQGEGEDEEGGRGGKAAGSRQGDEEEEEGGGLVISLDRQELAGAGAKKRRKPGPPSKEVAARRGVSKIDRHRALLVHRSHALCLLARGLLFDTAADDPLLQAQLLSLLPYDRLLKLQGCGASQQAGKGKGKGKAGSSGSSEGGGLGRLGCSLHGVHQQVSWFRREFRLLPTPQAVGGGNGAAQGGGAGPSKQQGAGTSAAAASAAAGGSQEGDGDLIVAALRGSRGAAGLVEELRAAVEQRGTHSAEQYVALFAALLRSQGAAVRLVRAVQASSLKPTEADKQQRAAMSTAALKLGPAAAAYSGCCSPMGGGPDLPLASPKAKAAFTSALATLEEPVLLVGSQQRAVARAASAASALLSGRDARWVESQKERYRKQYRLPDTSSVYYVGSQGAELAGLPPDRQPRGLDSTFVIDAAKAHQQRKKQWKAQQVARANEEIGEDEFDGWALVFGKPGGGGGGGGRGRVFGGASGRGRGRAGGRGRSGSKQRATEAAVAAPAAKPASGAAAARARAAAAAAAAAKGGGSGGTKRKAEVPAEPAAAAGGSKGQASEEVEVIVIDSDSEEEAVGAAKQQQQQQQQQQEGQEGQQEQQEGQAGQQSKRRRKGKGDIIEAAELALALEVSKASTAAAAAAAAAAGASSPRAARGPMRGKGAPSAVTPQAAGKSTVASSSASKGKGKAKGKGKSAAAAPASPPERKEVVAAGVAVSAQRADLGTCWVEVFCRQQDEEGFDLPECRWVHVDPLTGWVDEAHKVEASLHKALGPLCYAAALAGGGARDVTRRYASDWLAAEKARDGEWWEDTLCLLAPAGSGTGSPQQGGGSPPDTGLAAKLRRDLRQGGGEGGAQKGEEEEAELAVIEEQARSYKPSTIEGFKNHPKYVLERHIGKYQALRPGAHREGMHKNEPFWQRKFLADLHNADQWRRLGFEVLPEELGNPVKRIKKRGMGGGGSASKGSGRGRGQAGGGGGGAEGTPASGSMTIDLDPEAEDGEEFGEGEVQDPATLSSFYGDWQTRPWKPPAAQGGRVPKNERGNVEVPPLSKLMPEGTVHLRVTGLGPICRKLGIDYAPALMDFTVRGGRNVPVIEGVVVCEEHREAVLDAHAEYQRVKAEKERQKRDEEAEAAWRALLRSVLARVRVQQAYGDGGEEGMPAGAGAMADAAAALLEPGAGDGAGQKRGAGGKKAAQAVAEAAAGKRGRQQGAGTGDGGAGNGQRRQPEQQQQQQQRQQQQEERAEHLEDVKMEEI